MKWERKKTPNNSTFSLLSRKYRAFCQKLIIDRNNSLEWKREASEVSFNSSLCLIHAVNWAIRTQQHHYSIFNSCSPTAAERNKSNIVFFFLLLQHALGAYDLSLFPFLFLSSSSLINVFNFDLSQVCASIIFHRVCSIITNANANNPLNQMDGILYERKKRKKQQRSKRIVKVSIQNGFATILW